MIEIDKEDQKKEKEVSIGIAKLGLDHWETLHDRVTTFDELELCSTCTSARALKTKYGKLSAFCYEFDLKLNNVDPVIECLSYIKKGSMNLNQMKEIATLIDIDTKKIGFKQ